MRGGELLAGGGAEEYVRRGEDGTRDVLYEPGPESVDVVETVREELDDLVAEHAVDEPPEESLRHRAYLGDDRIPFEGGRDEVPLACELDDRRPRPTKQPPSGTSEKTTSAKVSAITTISHPANNHAPTTTQPSFVSNP